MITPEEFRVLLVEILEEAPTKSSRAYETVKQLRETGDVLLAINYVVKMATGLYAAATSQEVLK